MARESPGADVPKSESPASEPGRAVSLLFSARPGGVVVRRLLPAMLLIPTLIRWLILSGQSRGWYDARLSFELMALAVIVPLAAMVWWLARLLDRDDCERLLTEQKLREMTVTDELTGLYNRRGFFQLSYGEIKRALRERRAVSVLYLDVDDFKSINDTWGHDEGDRALRLIAGVLKATLRPSDIVARLGGDEFTVLLVEDQMATEKISERLMRNLEKENGASGAAYPVKLCSGTACSDTEGYSVDALLSSADRLMFARKKARRGPAGALLFGPRPLNLVE